MNTGSTVFTNEEWRPIAAYPGYDVSSEGRIRSHVNNRAKKLGTPVIIGETYLCGGYKVVGMKRGDGSRKVERIHRLVAATFCHREIGQDLVRHLDDVRTNNRVSNLAWGTDADNKRDALRNNKVPEGDNHPETQIKNAQVREIFLSDETCEVIARRLNITTSHVSNIRTGKSRVRATAGLGESPGAIGLGGRNRAHGAKLTREIAIEIYTSDAPAAEMARKFNISEPYIHRIRAGFKWASVTAGLPKPVYRRSIAGIHVNADGTFRGRSITGEQAIEIFLSPERGRDIARRFDITEALVSAIRNRHQWSHLTKELTPPDRPLFHKHRNQVKTSLPLGC